MERFYAVRVGRRTGLFRTWDECREQIWQYPNSEFKSFYDLKDVTAYMNFKEIKQQRKEFVRTHKDSKKPLHGIGAYAFSDGSYNTTTGIYGYGGFLVYKKKFYLLIGRASDPELAKMRNVTGEIMGAMAATQKAEELGIKEFSLFYDYSGISAWATGMWEATKNGTKAYASFMRKTDITINFIPVKAHNGVNGNEYADILAKYAVGNRLSKGQLLKLTEFSHISGIQLPDIPVNTKRERIEK